jgi:hypothetical protein
MPKTAINKYDNPRPAENEIRFTTQRRLGLDVLPVSQATTVDRRANSYLRFGAAGSVALHRSSHAR